MTVPLLCVQGADDPLLHPHLTSELVARFPTTDRQIETLPDVDYLSVVDVAAHPIARWIAAR
jgi:hypothetical protein